MVYGRVNELLEEFYKSFYDVEALSLKKGIKNLTTTELHVIEAIGHESISMNELSERLGITMGTATVAINKLLEKDFINRTRCSHDRRKVFVSLTDTGVSALDYHQNFHKTIISEITKNISENELTQFVDVFEKILGNIKLLTELVNPISIFEYGVNTVVEVVEIKGTSALREFFASIGINNGTKLLIKNKNETSILIEYNSIEKNVEFADAKNILAVKRAETI